MIHIYALYFLFCVQWMYVMLLLLIIGSLAVYFRGHMLGFTNQENHAGPQAIFGRVHSHHVHRLKVKI